MKYTRNKKRDALRQQRLALDLGMLPSTAMSRLRKIVLFNQLKKHDENDCIRCKQKIESPDQLSIEHIKPWEGNSVDLFWSLDNIAFSHLKCNVPHSRWGGRNKRKIGPDGTAWCIGHQDFLPVLEFSKCRTFWNGFQKYCKQCCSNRKTRVQSVASVKVAQQALNLTSESASLSRPTNFTEC